MRHRHTTFVFISPSRSSSRREISHQNNFIMSPTRPSPLSIELPPSPMFSHRSGELPKTPEPQFEEDAAIVEPPPPPKQTYKIKKRRGNTSIERPVVLTSPSFVTPSIEMSETVSLPSSPVYQSHLASGLLAPQPPFIDRPVTPAAQVLPKFPVLSSPASEWGLIDGSRTTSDFPHAGSVCSDSSGSDGSCSSYSIPIGSSGSPKSEQADPFADDTTSNADVSRPVPVQNDSPVAKRQKTRSTARWTTEMDQHLEDSYVSVLTDPRITPFKSFPGSGPPEGLCHKAAALARSTWRTRRGFVPGSLDAVLEGDISFADDANATIRPKHQPQWPRSNGQVRKRLRTIVKRKPQLHSYYQRLIRTRTPSPFPSSAPSTATPDQRSSTFSSRTMNVSLTTATAPSMQPDGPLAQLTSAATEQVCAGDDAPTSSHDDSQTSRPAGWFDRIGRSKAQQNRVSMTVGTDSLVEEGNKPQPFVTGVPLASPFEDAPNRSRLLHSMSTTKSLGRKEFDRQKGKVPSLDSPFEVKGAPTLPRKRRFKSDEEKPRRPGLEDVFGPKVEVIKPARFRGFSMGAAHATGVLNRMFDPPTNAYPTVSTDFEMTEAPPMPDLTAINYHSVPRRLAEPVPRLGSPFTEGPAAGGIGGARSNQRNTFPRSFVPSPANPQPFHQRLQELAARAAAARR